MWERRRDGRRDGWIAIIIVKNGIGLNDVIRRARDQQRNGNQEREGMRIGMRIQRK